MRTGGVFWFWGLLMAGILAVGAFVFGFNDTAPPALLGGTVALMAVLGAIVMGLRLDKPDEEYLRSHPDISPPMPLIGVSIGLLAFSVEVGWWLSLIAAGMIAFGIGGVVRERMVERGMLRRAIGVDASRKTAERGEP